MDNDSDYRRELIDSICDDAKKHRHESEYSRWKIYTVYVSRIKKVTQSYNEYDSAIDKLSKALRI